MGLLCGLNAAAAIIAVLIAGVLPATAENTNDPVVEIAKIPAKGFGIFGGEIEMVTQIFKPEGNPPFPVVIFSHGRSPEAEKRAALKYPIPLGHVKYWLQKGFAVVAPIRPGFGETGGTDHESSGSHYNASGICDGKADHGHAVGSAKDVMAIAVNWVHKQPWVMADKMLLEGQSLGGITTVALCAANYPGVIGCINFAGGSGGHPKSQGKVCNPEVIDELMRGWGATTKVPSIWFYAANDMYWGPDNPKQWHKSFAAGGSPTTFVGTEPLPNEDGHQLLYKGGKMWSMPLNEWLQERGFPQHK